MFGFIRRRRYARIIEKARNMAQTREPMSRELQPRHEDPFTHAGRIQGFKERRGDRRAEERRKRRLPVAQERRSGERRCGLERRHSYTLRVEQNYHGRQLSRARRNERERLRRIEEELLELERRDLERD